MVSYFVGENSQVRFPNTSPARPCKCSSKTRVPSSMLEQAVLVNDEVSECERGIVGIREKEAVKRPIAIRKSYDFVSMMILQLLQG